MSPSSLLPRLLCLALLAPAAIAAPLNVSDRNVPMELGAQRQTVVEGLEHPWSLAWLPDGRVLITERPGRLRVVKDGVLQPEPIRGLPSVFAQGQGGLLDIAPHPDFQRNRWLYLTYAHGDAQANRTRLARGVLEGDELRDVQVLFEVAQAKPGAQHFGSRLLWLPDGSLLMSIGDGGNPPTRLGDRFIRDYARDKTSHLGKVLRMDAEGRPLADNPFAGRPDADARVWSIGHRNIQGLAYDSVRRTVWANEHGALGGDELNQLQAGADYGWPEVSRSREYRSGAAVGSARSAPGVSEPHLLWEVAVAPSGLVVYDGKAFPAWQGDVFSGSLMGMDVRRLDLDEGGKLLGETALRVGARVRDVRQGPDGLLYVLTDERNGRLLRYRPAGDSQTPAPVPPATR